MLKPGEGSEHRLEVGSWTLWGVGVGAAGPLGFGVIARLPPVAAAGTAGLHWRDGEGVGLGTPAHPV